MFDPDLPTLCTMLVAGGAKRILVKRLAENDNSKNQPYLGKDFSILSYIPNDGPVADYRPGAKRQNFKAKISWHWLKDDGGTVHARGAQLILYPDYPEVRLSGFLKGTRGPWNSVLDGRQSGRVLAIGIRPDGRIIAYAAGAHSRLAHSLSPPGAYEAVGVFEEIPLPTAPDSRSVLVSNLRRISAAGWINSKRLVAPGTLRACESLNCGGFTLEAELGIITNGRAEPDFHGWEIKQHNVSRFDRPSTRAVTLLTPEPKRGFYAQYGVERFIRKYGYADTKGRHDRFNFGGVYLAGRRVPRTGLTLVLNGWDTAAREIVDVGGEVALVDDQGELAAAWPFETLLNHWRKKHDKACFVMSMCRIAPHRQYRYASEVTLAVDPDPLAFIRSLAEGKVYLDPAAKLENASTTPRVKARSQFRTKAPVIPTLYRKVEQINTAAS